MLALAVLFMWAQVVYNIAVGAMLFRLYDLMEGKRDEPETATE